jgi:hypothetical protein
MVMEERYKTILVIITGLLIAALFFIYKQKADTAQMILYSTASLALIILLFPIFGEWIVLTWFKLAETLGWLNSKILLTIVFFIFLTPMAFITKFFHKDSLSLTKSNKSLFEERNLLYTAKDMEQPW